MYMPETYVHNGTCLKGCSAFETYYTVPLAPFLQNVMPITNVLRFRLFVVIFIGFYQYDAYLSFHQAIYIAMKGKLYLCK